MSDDGESGVVEVDPGWNLSVSDEVHVPHPWSECLDGPQRIAQLLNEDMTLFQI